MNNVIKNSEIIQLIHVPSACNLLLKIKFDVIPKNAPIQVIINNCLSNFKFNISCIPNILLKLINIGIIIMTLIKKIAEVNSVPYRMFTIKSERINVKQQQMATIEVVMGRIF